MDSIEREMHIAMEYVEKQLVNEVTTNSDSLIKESRCSLQKLKTMGGIT